MHGSCVLDLYIFKEGGYNIVYCPALDLSGYGKTEKDAKESFDTVFAEFIRYTTNKGTLLIELKKLGWKVKDSKQKIFNAPSFEELYNKKGELYDIVSSKNYKKVDREVAMPC
ncbi:MAG: hypothetical protein K0R51_1552 [Cytophagaceae bacterium]|jgi:hypothetical protein|nr:hypothetical protein [Cytophagaceae bacterium]